MKQNTKQTKNKEKVNNKEELEEVVGEFGELVGVEGEFVGVEGELVGVEGELVGELVGVPEGENVGTFAVPVYVGKPATCESIQLLNVATFV